MTIRLVPPLLEAYPPPEGLVDLRRTSLPENDHGGREWEDVSGITLHQTACILGERPGRWNTVSAHLGVMRSGASVWMHDFNRIVWHAQGFNRRCAGIEIDGNYEGVEGDPSTLWDNPGTAARDKATLLTIESIETTKQLIRWICSVVAVHGGQVKALVAHRQSSATRRNDPGSGIWSRIALPMHDELGLSDGGDGFRIGQGYPIPAAWDPKRTGRY